MRILKLLVLIALFISAESIWAACSSYRLADVNASKMVINKLGKYKMNKITSLSTNYFDFGYIYIDEAVASAGNVAPSTVTCIMLKAYAMRTAYHVGNDAPDTLTLALIREHIISDLKTAMLLNKKLEISVNTSASNPAGSGHAYLETRTFISE